MKLENRVTVWRRNKANAHRLLIIKSTWDQSWAVIDYNPEIVNRKFVGWQSAIAYARHQALARSITRLSIRAAEAAAAVHVVAAETPEHIGGDAA